MHVATPSKSSNSICPNKEAQADSVKTPSFAQVSEGW